MGHAEWNEEIGRHEPMSCYAVIIEAVPDDTRPGWYLVEGRYLGGMSLQFEKLTPVPAQPRAWPVSPREAGMSRKERRELERWMPEADIGLVDGTLVVSAPAVTAEWLETGIPDGVRIQPTLLPV